MSGRQVMQALKRFRVSEDPEIHADLSCIL